MKEMSGKIILFISIIISLFITIVSVTGLVYPDIYSKETFNWKTQSVTQDAVDLFLVMPSLMITAILAFKKNKIAGLFWSGVIFYLIYTFVIYCFALHFNRLFIVYCTTLGLCFYSFMYFLLSQIQKPIIKSVTSKSVRRTIGIYFIVISCLFYLLWLAEIVPAIINQVTPASLIETGLLTNPVYVIDLSVCLPALFITGFLLLGKNVLGSLLTPAMLVFLILMDLTIGALTVLMKSKGLTGDYSVAVAMFVLALLSMVLLIWCMKHVEVVE